MTEELRNEKIQREALEMELAQVKEELVQNEELRQLEVTLFNEKLDELDKQVQEIDENDVIIVTPSTRRLSSSSSAQQRSSVERKVSVQETLSESIKRVKTFASERLQETNVPEHDDSINNNSVFDDASLYYSLPSEMKEWNESLVTKNQSFYSQQSISNNALLKFLQEKVSRLTEENTVSRVKIRCPLIFQSKIVFFTNF
ncbi:PREDICTED: uncharacterized protein LOC109589068 [Amphimedon queenslandica]|uniref:Uncharacterized protein n=2 Tax=Amphimedon queenslandica TaxID=400682 RepID=A0AAN0JUC5_AMPQE|nr:PREDICTED: uncharacterized protein LOC109589068 [Amphimedon queenslandica]|eukprot:XP_019860748.1 PREDICTED: uncharacterized protein LOC109589068 [Amphimedon queenslandica]